MDFISVDLQEIAINVPLPWALYGKDRSLLIGEGGVISSEERMESLAKLGFFREADPDEKIGAENCSQNMPQPEKPPRDNVAKSVAMLFSEIGLKAGDRMQIEPPAILSQDRLLVQYVGHLKDVSILVTLPTSNGFALPLREGEDIVVRAFSGQNVFGFKSTIERVCKIPFNYLHLSYPEQVSGMMVRKSPRIKTNIIATVKNTAREKGSEKYSGVIKNLSTTGAGLGARQTLGSKGDLLNLAFRADIHNVDMYMSINAKILALIPQPTKGDLDTIFHGLEFQDLNPNDCMLLQSMIYRQMVENPDNLM